MSFASKDEIPPVVESAKVLPLKPKHPYRLFGLLLAFNSLSVLAMVATNCFIPIGISTYQLVNFLNIANSAVLESQLFLLAFWMSFGGWPRRWRSLYLFGITMCAGFVFALSMTAVVVWNGATAQVDSPAYLVTMVVGFPIFASALLWLTNAVFVIPAWYFGKELNFHNPETNKVQHQRTFGISQMLSWTAQVAVPFALMNLFILLADDEQVSFGVAIPFLIVVACCSPLAVVMLQPRFSFPLLVAVCAWAALIGILSSLFANHRDSFLPPWALIVNCLAVILNTLALRRMGLCWQPRVEVPRVAQFDSPEAGTE